MTHQLPECDVRPASLCRAAGEVHCASPCATCALNRVARKLAVHKLSVPTFVIAGPTAQRRVLGTREGAILQKCRGLNVQLASVVNGTARGGGVLVEKAVLDMEYPGIEDRSSIGSVAILEINLLQYEIGGIENRSSAAG